MIHLRHIEEDIRLGILQEMIQDKSLQDYLYLQPVTTYVAATRQAVMDYMMLKVRLDDGGVAPMDLSSLVPEGKGKGKDGKDKGEGKGKYNTRPQVGRLLADCRGAAQVGKTNHAGRPVEILPRKGKGKALDLCAPSAASAAKDSLGWPGWKLSIERGKQDLEKLEEYLAGVSAGCGEASGKWSSHCAGWKPGGVGPFRSYIENVATGVKTEHRAACKWHLRRLYISGVELQKFGYAVACLGRLAHQLGETAKAHSEECRTRIVQAGRDDPEIQKRLVEAD
eukprot:1385935-Amphidinium_carterae.1